MPRPYPSEFRERALELVRSGRTVVDVAATLGIAQSRATYGSHRNSFTNYAGCRETERR